jgi:hypothetical protein
VTRQSVAPERSYYDTVRGGENAPSTLWQETLRSEEMNKYNFHALSRDGKTIQKEDLLRAFGQVDVDALAKVRSYLHWSPYDRVRVVNADP